MGVQRSLTPLAFDRNKHRLPHPGIAQLGERQIWDLEAVRAGLTTWTIHAGVLELVYKMVLKTIAHMGLRDRDPSPAPRVTAPI